MPFILIWNALMSRSLFAWLCLPLLALCSLFALAEPGDGAIQALHLLGYLGADYPATVSAGQVVDPAEYREQLEFAGVLQGLIVALPAKAGRDELEQGVQHLRRDIDARAEGAAVATNARQLAARLAELYQVRLTPAITPDPSRGARGAARSRHARSFQAACHPCAAARAGWRRRRARPCAWPCP